ncbi:nucleoid-associated protein [Daejeonella sp. H1SJ63]|uniref:nucleoid-associated protein n=1 Tax=Daejeonella sp. H1SJ63 TaxID=3034145 RepID=UPI0023ECE3F5|nr:nucleoid-associated protein [Daejeonella sp. H1SJ63]
MVTSFEAALEQLSVHRTGNKLQNEFYILSDLPLQIQDETLKTLLMQYFLSPFEKGNEVYRFMHSSDDLNLNEVFHFCSLIFADPDSFHEQSANITRHLFNVSNHPKIKSGELYVAIFKDLQLEGELVDAIGIFKSETKESYLKVNPDKGGFSLSYEEDAINIQKLDKGCLIFNTEMEDGYKVMVIDQTNRTDAVYWKDEFLQLKIRNDSFNKTNTTLGICKDFITTRLQDDFEITKADKIDLLNRSMKYFKEKESFDIDEFSEEVIGNPKAIESFKNFSRDYSEEFDAGLDQSFDISNAAVKKQARVFKSVLKLDKNFHIYIHGNKELIEKGFDDNRAMNYYKVYYKEEN